MATKKKELNSLYALLKDKRGFVVPALLLTLGTIVSSIFAGITNVAQGVFNVAKTIFDYLFHLFEALYRTAPKPFKLLIWLFLLLFVSNVVVGTILHMNFYCKTDNTLLRPSGFFDGIKLYFTTTFTDITNNTLTYNEFIANNTIAAPTYTKGQPEGIFVVACLNQTPRLTLFGFLDFLSYRLWILLLLIGLLVIVIKNNW